MDKEKTVTCEHLFIAYHHFIKAGKNKGKLSRASAWVCMACNATKKYE